MKLNEDIKNQLVERLKPLNPERVILFGSYAYGQPSRDSDIDLIVVTTDGFVPQNFKENSEIYLKVSKRLRDIQAKIPIDLIVFTKPMYEKFVELKGMFSKKVLREGITLI
ncbi:MAG: nucleotidyltransferase domain-containing protein [Candidatus Jettenia caeni]|nr:nucleotidyltransferase domain-containing protein [Candidatus Jettenia caeni]